MSLRVDKLKIDRLPTKEELANPLRTRLAAPQRIEGARQAKPSIVRRLMPPRAPDTSDDSDSDSSEDDDRAVEKSKLLGPFTVRAKTREAKLSFVACFKESSTGPVTIRFSDLVKNSDSAEIAETLNTFDCTRTVPISLRVTGMNFAPGTVNNCHVEIYDHSGKSLFSKNVVKANNDTVFNVGFPLFMFVAGKENMVLYNPPVLSEEHLSWWQFDLSSLETDVGNYTHPTTRESFKTFAKNSMVANLMNFCLSIRNKLIVPPLLVNPSYASKDHDGIIQLPADLFVQAFNALKKKMAEISSKSFDLSSIKVFLKPFPGAHGSPLHGSIGLELVAHVPLKKNFQPSATEQKTKQEKADSSENDSSDSDL